MKKFLITIISLCLAAGIAPAQKITQHHKDRAEEYVRKMTLDEKIDFISGKIDGFHTMAIERLGIPSIRMADGPQGVRNNTISTLYPCGVAAAASFDREGAYDMGKGIGQDARARGVGIMLGPGVNIYRSALNGRNFEYFGEDPYLASETAVSYIKGLQSEGVMATIKHYALNNSEYDRHGISSVIDERTAHEIYFETFRKAVQEAKVGAVMTSYNMVNGIHAPENPWLIRTVLRGQWGFEGLVMSDWSSTYSTQGCIQGGLDLEMPRNYVYRPQEIKALLESGVISEKDIDEKVRNILQTLLAFDLIDRNAVDSSIPENNPFSNEVARKLSYEAPVLLKNNGVLPLKPGKKNTIALIGPMADNMPCGGGSGEVNPFPENSVTIEAGMSLLGKNYPCVYYADPKAHVAEIEKAKTVVVAVGFGKKPEGEGHDRTYGLPDGQDALIDFALKHNSNVVVVVVSGGEIDITRWADGAAAILMAWYDGQNLGDAVASILSGKVNPSGRLPFTFWGSEEKNPTYKNYHPTMTALGNATAKSHKQRFGRYQYAEYKEGVFLGYRGIEKFGKKPLYPFGFGLSYTDFAYSDMAVVPSGDGFDVSFKVTNVGKVAGAAVPQVYVAPVNPSLPRPVRELKGYDKVRLGKGESKTVTIHLDHHAFSHYSVEDMDWKADGGTYKVQLCTDAMTPVIEIPVEI